MRGSPWRRAVPATRGRGASSDHSRPVADNFDFIAGDDYSIADIACYPWIVPHERQGQKLAAWYLANATEFKYVVDDGADLAYALGQLCLHDKPRFLQPNALNPDAVRLCVDAVLANASRLRLSLQTHKLLEIR